MLNAVVKTVIMCAVWYTSHLMPSKAEQLRHLCAGFCVAEALSVLSGRCAWMYSVVFGEYMGFLMLTVTVFGAVCLFELLSGSHSRLLLTTLYVFFSSAESEYISSDTPIISALADGVSHGIVGINDSRGKGFALLLAFAAIGNFANLSGAQMPSAFAAISCCALLCRGMKDIAADRYCCFGAVVACLLSYL